jgi:hypothetical protein
MGFYSDLEILSRQSSCGIEGGEDLGSKVVEKQQGNYDIRDRKWADGSSELWDWELGLG